MSSKDFLARVYNPRVHVDPALCRHQVATDGVNSHRVVLDALAFSRFIGCENIELSLQIFTVIRILELIEEPFHQSPVSASTDQMPGGSPSHRLSSKGFHVHAADE